MRIFTLRDGTKRKIKIEEGMTLQDELKKAAKYLAAFFVNIKH